MPMMHPPPPHVLLIPTSGGITQQQPLYPFYPPPFPQHMSSIHSSERPSQRIPGESTNISHDPSTSRLPPLAQKQIEKRKENHKEVEKRRRTQINLGIQLLEAMIPWETLPPKPSQSPVSPNSPYAQLMESYVELMTSAAGNSGDVFSPGLAVNGARSKSQVLFGAVEYLKQLKSSRDYLASENSKLTRE